MRQSRYEKKVYYKDNRRRNYISRPILRGQYPSITREMNNYLSSYCIEKGVKAVAEKYDLDEELTEISISFAVRQSYSSIFSSWLVRRIATRNYLTNLLDDFETTVLASIVYASIERTMVNQPKLLLPTNISEKEISQFLIGKLFDEQSSRVIGKEKKEGYKETLVTMLTCADEQDNEQYTKHMNELCEKYFNFN